MKKIAFILALMIVSPVWADGMNFNFANPAFNGGPGWSDHVLRMETVEQQRLQSKKDAAKAEEEAQKAQAEAEEKARLEAEASKPKKKTGGLGFLLAGLGIVAAVVTFGATRDK